MPNDEDQRNEKGDRRQRDKKEKKTQGRNKIIK